MKTIRIIRLTLDNFKCYRHYEFAPEGRGCALYGENGTGKSTLYDAFTWLLFGKDSKGGSSPDLKPHDGSGQVLDHQAVTAVEGELSVDGARLTLRRTYFEKWSAKRGGARETFDGHSSDFFVDGVPVKKYEYARRVDELVDEERFRLLTNVHYFCGALGWRERRAALFELIQAADDRTLMEAEPKFAPLAAVLGGLTLDELVKKTQARRRGHLGVRDELPARLDECKKTVQELEAVDFQGLGRELAERRERREALHADLLKLEQNTLLDSRRNDRDRLRNQLDALEQANAAHRKGQEVPGPDLAGLERELGRARDALARAKSGLDACGEDEKRFAGEVEGCRARWKEADGRRFSGEDCPTCGRPLEGKALSEARERFEAEKRAALDMAVSEAGRWKARLAEAQAREEAMTLEKAELEERVSRLEREAEEARRFRPPEISDLPGYAADRRRLEVRLSDVEQVIAAHAADGAAVRREIEGKLAALDGEIKDLVSQCARQGLLEYSRERMDKLRAEGAQAAAELEELDKLLFLCQEFTRYKAKRVSEQINSRFALVRWKLFEEQVNGGLAECCQATVDGSAYGGGLNDGGMVKAGLDVIAAFSRHYGVRVPLFVDGAESVTGMPEMETQVIRLAVSGPDKKLRCEYGP